MKRTILILIFVATASSVAIHYMAGSARQSAPSYAPTPVDEFPMTQAPKTNLAQSARSQLRAGTDGSNQTPNVRAPGSAEAIAFAAAIDTLVSPHATYAEKQAAWKQLKDSGRLVDAAAELEQRMAADPKNAVYPAALGQAYLNLCATSTDVRQQAIWAMKADEDFETALNLDPSNWDARFTKAVGMSYWPDNLNKGGEVIQQFNTLIEQQEQQSPQPQFAQTYAWLGKQYQKAGQMAAAQQIWQRGTALYPDNQSLQELLAAASAAAPPQP
jgi:tetratricopeptide (TPR) repeat protein